MLFLLKKEQVTQCDSTCFIEINFFTRKLLPKKITFFCYQSNSCRILKQAPMRMFFFSFSEFCSGKDIFLEGQNFCQQHTKFKYLHGFCWAVWHSCWMRYRNQWQIRGRKAPSFGWATFGWASCSLYTLFLALDLAV